jgi:hypothetical protein
MGEVEMLLNTVNVLVFEDGSTSRWKRVPRDIQPIPGKSVVWRPWPGYTAAPRETIEFLATVFPEHEGHRVTAEATIDLSQRFWCYNCKGTFGLPLVGFPGLLGLSIGKRLAGAPDFHIVNVKDDVWPHLEPTAQCITARQEGLSVPQNLRHLCRKIRLNALKPQLDLSDARMLAHSVNCLMGAGLIETECMALPVAMRLANMKGEFHRGMLVWLLSSRYSNAELNAAMGLRLFVNEGELGDGPGWAGLTGVA